MDERRTNNKKMKKSNANNGKETRKETRQTKTGKWVLKGQPAYKKANVVVEIRT